MTGCIGESPFVQANASETAESVVSVSVRRSGSFIYRRHLPSASLPLPPPTHPLSLHCFSSPLCSSLPLPQALVVRLVSSVLGCHIPLRLAHRLTLAFIFLSRLFLRFPLLQASPEHPTIDTSSCICSEINYSRSHLFCVHGFHSELFSFLFHSPFGPHSVPQSLLFLPGEGARPVGGKAVPCHHWVVANGDFVHTTSASKKQTLLSTPARHSHSWCRETSETPSTSPKCPVHLSPSFNMCCFDTWVTRFKPWI